VCAARPGTPAWADISQSFSGYSTLKRADKFFDFLYKNRGGVVTQVLAGEQLSGDGDSNGQDGYFSL